MFGSRGINHNAHYTRKTTSSAGTTSTTGLPYGSIVAQVQSSRTFATSANLRGSYNAAKYFDLGLGLGACDEGQARVINSDNSYPNNERKMTTSHLQDDGISMGAMEGAIIIAAAAAVGSPVIITSGLRRTVSECTSEDSYIVFEGCGSDLDDLDSYFGSDDELQSEEDQEPEQMKPDEDAKQSIDQDDTHSKKVHFPPDEHLAVVHRMVVWSFAHRACRKGPWEEYVRDRARFLRRIDCCREALTAVLQPAHRERIYRQRFALSEGHQQRKGVGGSDFERITTERKKHRHKRRKGRRSGRKKRRNRHRRRR